MSNSLPGLIIFDCDGVLVDSEPLAEVIFHDLVSTFDDSITHQISLEAYNTGGSLQDSFDCLTGKYKIDLGDLEVLVQRYRDEQYRRTRDELTAIAGVSEVISGLDCPICVASGGPREKIRVNLEAAGLFDRFADVIFSSYEINSWKPDPGIFLHAANRLAVAPENCVVIEDSVIGVQAAVAAGMPVFGYADRTPAAVLESHGAISFDKMDQLGSLLRSRSRS